MGRGLYKKQVQVFIFICIAVISLAIGYAAISSIILSVNGTGEVSVDSSNYDVHFDITVNPTMTANMGSATIDQLDDKVAHITVTGLTKKDDSATAEYTVVNDSNSIGANISLELTNTNTEYFRVTETILDKQLQAGDTTKVRITVELLKTPISEVLTSDIIARLEAEPMDNASATSSAGNSIVGTRPYVYTINDSSDITEIGQAISGVTEYSRFKSAKENFGHPISLAHSISSGIITESYIAYEYSGTVYYLRGGAGDEFGQTPTRYNENVSTIKTIVGSSWSDYCEEEIGDDYKIFSCTKDGKSYEINTTGAIDINLGDAGCYIYSGGSSYCS